LAICGSRYYFLRYFSRLHRTNFSQIPQELFTELIGLALLFSLLLAEIAPRREIPGAEEAVRDLRRRMGVLLGSRVLDFIRGDSSDHDGRADHVGGAILTSGASRHGCFLAVIPNQPEDDGEYGVPDVALPNAALPIARGQRGCLT
jgi:hypothetical protein